DAQPAHAWELQTLVDALIYHVGEVTLGKEGIPASCPTDATTVATVPLVFQDTHLPTIQTQLPVDTTLVVRFAGLPTHLPPEVLHQELMEGLAAYGSNPILHFVVPNGATRLAGPW
ncbi:hypothetical protein L0F63_006938, partial [Massospora cicadina]